MSNTIIDTLAGALHHHEIGEFALAEQAARSILVELPDHAGAFHLLGLIAAKRGDLVQAAQNLNHSLLGDGCNPLAWAHLGDVHLAGGNIRAALANYEEAIRLRPDFAEAHHSAGVARFRLKEWTEAADCFRQATIVRPTFAAAYNSWGLALRAEFRPLEAASLFERAAELEPTNLQFAFNMAATLHVLGELDRAAPAYRRILSVWPDHVDSAINLAIILKEQGRFDESIHELREILKHQPGHALAFYTLSEFAADGRYQFSADELKRIRDVTASPGTPALDRSHCCFALASTLNREGTYDQAFSYYKQANDLRRGVLQGQNQAFDARAHEAYVDRIVAEQDEKHFKRTLAWGTATNLPIFIVGMPRSGSTLVEQILASHPRVFGAGEVGEVPEFFSRWAQSTRPQPPLPPGQITAHGLAFDFLQRAQRIGAGADRVVLKNLDNFLYLGAIATLFPGARVIHCRRDPLDVCLSCYFQNFTHVTFAWSLDDIGAYYRGYEKLMTHWRRVLPLHIHEVRYEDLVQDQEAVTRDLLVYCGLDWDERCLAYFKTRRAVRTASSVQVRKPISNGAIGRWKHYRGYLGPLFAAVGLRVAGTAAPPAGVAPELAPSPASQQAPHLT